LRTSKAGEEAEEASDDQQTCFHLLFLPIEAKVPIKRRMTAAATDI